MSRMVDILFFLKGRNCSEVWQLNGLFNWIKPMTNSIHKDVILMLSAAADGVGSRLTGETIFSVAAIVADSHEILLFPLERGKNQDDRDGVRLQDMQGGAA